MQDSRISVQKKSSILYALLPTSLYHYSKHEGEFLINLICNATLNVPGVKLIFTLFWGVFALLKVGF